MTSPQTVAQMASALAFIVERHRPDTFNAAQQGSDLSGVLAVGGHPGGVACDDRQAVGRLMPDPASNRLLEPRLHPPAGWRPVQLAGRLMPAGGARLTAYPQA